MDRRGLLGLMAAGVGTLAIARTACAAPAGPMPIAGRVHRLVMHVDRDDALGMRLALGNAHNAVSYFKDKGEKVEIEIVANGFGVTMLSESSPVKARLAALRRKQPDIALSACGNSIKMLKQQGKDFTLVDGARVVPAGIARLTELQEQGWAYVKP